MVEGLGRRIRGAYEKSQKLTIIEWLVILLAVLVLAIAVYSGIVELHRQGRSREMLAQLKAARLAASVVSSEQYAKGAAFADFSTDDGFATGVGQSIRTLGALPGSVQLLQTDADGYAVQSLAYTDGGYVAVYDADGSWHVYIAEDRIHTTFDPAK